MMSLPATDQTPTRTERAILAGGCFWGLEDLLHRAKGSWPRVSAILAVKCQIRLMRDITATRKPSR